MTDQVKNMNVIFFIIFQIMSFLLATAVYCQTKVIRQIAFATDASGKGLFLLNPAIEQPGSMELDSFVMRSSFSHKLRSEQTANLSEIKSEGKEDVLAVGLGGDAGSGLGLALTHMRSMYKTESSNLTSRAAKSETFDFNHTTGRAIIEMTPTFRLGVQVSFMRINHHIYGSMSVNSANSTAYDGILYGTGGGLYWDLKPAILTMAYLAPLKGKSEIYGEEFIITEPGIAEAMASVQRGKYIFGGAYRRSLYKHDDRFGGTTVNDGNQTRIELMGIDRENNNIFFKNHIQIGLQYLFTAVEAIKLDATYEAVEFNFSPDTVLSGQDDDLNNFRYLTFSTAYKNSFRSFDYELGIHYVTLDHEFEERNRKFYYSGNRNEIVFKVSKGSVGF
ncbi:MAG: hypothetical protein R3B45_17790 [Bdellovibrionota bacterium]